MAYIYTKKDDGTLVISKPTEITVKELKEREAVIVKNIERLKNSFEKELLEIKEAIAKAEELGVVESLADISK